MLITLSFRALMSESEDDMAELGEACKSATPCADAIMMTPIGG